MIAKKKNKRKHGKRQFKKQEKQARFAMMKKLHSKKHKKLKKLKINWRNTYQIIFNFLHSNFFINLQEVGGISKFWISSGFFGFKGRKKNKYDTILASSIRFIRKVIFSNTKYPFAVWKGIPKRLYRTVIKSIKFTNKKYSPLEWRGSLAYIYIPFNGCRRRKPKRR